MSVELGMMVYKGTVYLMESDSTKPTRKSKSVALASASTTATSTEPDAQAQDQDQDQEQDQEQAQTQTQTHNRVYIYDPIQPIQVGLWNSSAGMCFFPGVEDALREGNRDALLSLVSEKIS